MEQTPVAGVDVSKRFSDMCILSPSNKVFAKTKIYHDLTSMQKSLEPLHQAESMFGAKPVIVMESTSHYHLLLCQFMRRAGYEVIVINPIQSSALHNINVRKVKNDKVDAYRIAMLYRMKLLRSSVIPDEMLNELRALCRQHCEVKQDITRYANRLTALLDQSFPGYDAIFSRISSMTSLAVLARYPSAQAILQAPAEELSQLIYDTSRKGRKYSDEKTARLKKIADAATKFGILHSSNDTLVQTVVATLQLFFANVDAIDLKMEEIINGEPHIKENVLLLQTIPGMGQYSSVVILAEIGDFSAFEKPKQLTAFFGLDPSVNQSGTFQGTKNKISKRGTRYARGVLHMVARNSVHPHCNGEIGNPVLADYYQKKLSCKPAKVALCAVMHKIVNIIFAVLRDQKPFELRNPEEHARKLREHHVSASDKMEENAGQKM